MRFTCQKQHAYTHMCDIHLIIVLCGHPLSAEHTLQEVGRVGLKPLFLMQYLGVSDKVLTLEASKPVVFWNCPFIMVWKEGRSMRCPKFPGSSLYFKRYIFPKARRLQCFTRLLGSHESLSSIGTLGMWEMYVNTDLSSVALKRDFHFYFHFLKKNLFFFQNPIVSDHITCQVTEASLVNINQTILFVAKTLKPSISKANSTHLGFQKVGGLTSPEDLMEFAVFSVYCH